MVCQPMRWSLRLGEDAADSLSALCVVRDAEGRWLAGRRAAWVATWPGRWALGAGGSVEVGEHPVETLPRELHEEWSLVPDELTVEALIRIPSGMVMLVGLARVSRRLGPGHGRRARPARVVAARPGGLARGGRHAATADGHTAGRGLAAGGGAQGRQRPGDPQPRPHRGGLEAERARRRPRRAVAAPRTHRGPQLAGTRGRDARCRQPPAGPPPVAVQPAQDGRVRGAAAAVDLHALVDAAGVQLADAFPRRVGGQDRTAEAADTGGRRPPQRLEGIAATDRVAGQQDGRQALPRIEPAAVLVPEVGFVGAGPAYVWVSRSPLKLRPSHSAGAP